MPATVVTFTRAFIFVPPEDRRCAVKYPAGYRGPVRKVCAEMAIAAGAAVPDEPEEPEEPAATAATAAPAAPEAPKEPEVKDGEAGGNAGAADLPAKGAG